GDKHRVYARNPRGRVLQVFVLHDVAGLRELDGEAQGSSVVIDRIAGGLTAIGAASVEPASDRYDAFAGGAPTGCTARADLALRGCDRRLDIEAVRRIRVIGKGEQRIERLRLELICAYLEVLRFGGYDCCLFGVGVCCGQTRSRCDGKS